MTNQPHTGPSGVKRRWFQFSLRWLLAIVFVANLFFAWYFYAPPRWDRVRLHVDAGAVRVDGREVPWHKLESVLKSRIKRIQESGVILDAACVQISVNEEATYGDFKRAVKAAWDVELRRVELKTNDRIEPFVILFPPPDGDALDDLIPPFCVSIEVDKRGKLAQIGMPSRVVRANMLAQLRKEALTFVGKDTGPDSVREHAEVELACADHVKFKHVAAVLEAITEKAKSGGPDIPLIRVVAVRIQGYESRYEVLTGCPEPPYVPQLKLLIPAVDPLITPP